MVGLLSISVLKKPKILKSKPRSDSPVFISTWNNTDATERAYEHLLSEPDRLLDALEKGVNSVEENEKDTSVGYGGMPDSSGTVTLDACIMDDRFNAGSVCCLKDIVHAVSVARKVMENSPHVMLAGEGALSFALANGFKKKKLLTRSSRKAYKEWKKNPVFKPEVNSERHDTIGMLGIDGSSSLSGACSTSGLAFKMPGRVGDSPIIGSGLFVDNEVGAVCATGYGELIMNSCCSFLAVEKMRQGFTPEEACRFAIQYLARANDVSGRQAGLIAINKQGEVGAFAIRKGFIYTLADASGTRVLSSKSLL